MVTGQGVQQQSSQPPPASGNDIMNHQMSGVTPPGMGHMGFNNDPPQANGQMKPMMKPPAFSSQPPMPGGPPQPQPGASLPPQQQQQFGGLPPVTQAQMQQQPPPPASANDMKHQMSGITQGMGHMGFGEAPQANGPMKPMMQPPAFSSQPPMSGGPPQQGAGMPHQQHQFGGLPPVPQPQMPQQPPAPQAQMPQQPPPASGNDMKHQMSGITPSMGHMGFGDPTQANGLMKPMMQPPAFSSQPHMPGGPPQPGASLTPQQQQQQQFGGLPPAPQPQMQHQPPQPAAPGAQLPKRYPSYPQQPPMAPMPGQGQAPVNPTYPSYPQPNQHFQQPGMPQQPQDGYYAGPGVNAAPAGPGPQYPRQPGAVPQGGMAQPNYPQYGQQAQYAPNMGQPAYAQPSAQQGQKRLDPDQMPSAIGVMQEDQQTRAGIFRTDAKGHLPPLVTTKFQVEDCGNASPRFVRATMYSVPAQPDMLKQTAIPFALSINPFESPAKDEQAIPCVDLGPMGPVRCIRCKAYMSPLMQFIDGGRRFQCMLCKATTEVPPEYFQNLDHTGQRIDKWERPELWKGSYEFIATPEYCRNNVMPKEPAYIFVIDVSYNNVKSGLVGLLCSQMKNLLEALPSHTPVGFVTYNSKIHFYNIDPALGQPQMVIVPDVADMFMPLLRGFLVPRAEAMNSVDSLMEQIPALFGDTKETEAVLGPAIVAGMEALKASDRVGKLLVFHSSLPTSEIAPGKLKNREADRKLLGTEKEKTVLVPQSTYYNQLGQDCVGAGVSVDLYLFNNSYIDVATIGQVARLTGGSVNKYTYFQADIDGPRVVGDVILHLGRPIGFDAVMRVRTSTGVRPTDFFGHYYMANTTDVELAAIDSQKSIAVEIKHDASITDEDGVYIQIALLYTTIYGQRRLRVHNLALNTCMQMADLYRNCELDAVINFMAKQSISKSVETTPQDLKEGIIKRCAQMLATYRKHCANPSMPGQLILPECLKLLPLYVNCILRSDAVAGTSEITPDDRSWLMYTVMTMGVASTVHYFYPKLVPVADPKGSIDDPSPVRCSRDKLTEDSAFILENGIYVFMWIGSAVNPDWLQNIFGVANLAQINVETVTELPDHVNSDECLRLRAFVRSLRSERQRHMRLTLVRQRDKMELVMNRFLVEDRGSDGQPSYVDFLCHMHKEIRALLNQ